MRAISPFVIFAVFDVQVLKCCLYQVYKLILCTFIYTSTLIVTMDFILSKTVKFYYYYQPHHYRRHLFSQTSGHFISRLSYQVTSGLCYNKVK